MNSFQKWPPLNCLKGFEAAARLGNFSKAAAELNMTQSAVSHQIKTLEDYLGQELFLRANRQVTLSDAGIDLLETTQECLDVLTIGLNRLEHYKKPNQLIVHTSSAFASNWLIPRLPDFKILQQETDIWLYTTDGEPDLYMDEVHLAILYGDGNWPGMKTTKLMTDFLVPLCAPDHPAVIKGAENVGDLVNYNLLHGEQKETWHTWFSENGRPDINPITGSNFTNPAILLQAAKQGEGIALGSVILAAKEIENKELVSPYLQGIDSISGYYLALKVGGLKSTKIKPFITWLTEQALEFTEDIYSRLKAKFINS